MNRVQNSNMTSLRSNSESEILLLKKQIILDEKKQVQLENYIIQLQQKLTKQNIIRADIQRLKDNQSQIRDILKIKVGEIQQEKEILASQLNLTQELLSASRKQIEQLKQLYKIEMATNKDTEASKRMDTSRHYQNSNMIMLDQNYRISQLTKQIEIMKQLHIQEIEKIKMEYEKVIQKVQQEKSQFQKFMRLKDDERMRVKAPVFVDRGGLSQDFYSKELEKLFNRKLEEFEQNIRKKDNELMEIEDEMERIKLNYDEMEKKYIQMTAISQSSMEQIEALKGEKDILEKTLDFSKKIAQQQRNQFAKMLQIERDNCSIQIEELRQSLGKDGLKYPNQSDQMKRICNFILAKLKVVHAFVSDLKKYFQNEQMEMKQMFAIITGKLISSFQSTKAIHTEDNFPEYENLIEKYKAILKQKDKEILQLRRSKFRYSKNIEYLNKILVDD